MNRRNPFSVHDHNIVIDMTPRRSTRVFSRSHTKNSEGRVSASPAPECIVSATPKSGLSVVTRKRKVTLSPQPSPSCGKVTSPERTKPPSIDNKSITATRNLAMKRRTDDTSIHFNLSKRTKVGRWEKWEQITFLQGLREHGRGHWKVIAERIPTRYVSRTESYTYCYVPFA
jgi:hypothetical protein